MATDLSLNFVTWVDAPNSPSTPGAADLNRLQNNDNFFANRPGVVLRRDTGSAVPNANLFPITFRVADQDQDNMHPDPNGVLSTVTVKMSGWYDIRAFVMWSAPSGGATPTGWRSLRILKRNASQSTETTIWRDDKVPLPVANTGTGHMLAAPLTFLWNGEHIRVAVVHTQGATLNLDGGNGFDPTLSMLWVRN